MDTKEIDALIKLLDDPDPEITGLIQAKILSYGATVIPYLENAWEHSFDPTLQHNIEEIIHKIQFQNLKAELKYWSQDQSHDLLKGAILVARYQYPDLDEQKIRNQLSEIHRDAWIEMNEHLTAMEKVRILNHVFFDIHGFGGNTTNYHAPQNSFINSVLETKKGNPLLLSIIYQELAKDLDMPIYGVNLPEHFILAYMNEGLTDPIPGEKEMKVLFYINAFSKGSIFPRSEIDKFLKQLKIKPHPHYYEPCTNLEIIQRMIRNLIFSYNKLGHDDKVEELEGLLEELTVEK
jgi:regulator of sirC expression with transglutaminase-like and TPR domain